MVGGPDRIIVLRTAYGVQEIVVAPQGGGGLSWADILVEQIREIREKVPLRRMYVTRECFLQIARRIQDYT